MEQRYKAVLFDVDGTLLDTTEGVIAAVEYTINRAGLQMPGQETLLRFIGPPIQNSFRDTFRLSENEALELAAVFRNRYKGTDLLKAEPYVGIYGVCKALKQRGVKMAAATYKRQDYAEQILRHFGFGDYFQAMYGADYENRLQKMDIIRLCLKDLGIENYKQAVMVGDSSHDAEGAQAIGADFIGVTYGFGFRTKEEVLRYPAAGCAETPEEILQYIR